MASGELESLTDSFSSIIKLSYVLTYCFVALFRMDQVESQQPVAGQTEDPPKDASSGKLPGPAADGEAGAAPGTDQEGQAAGVADKVDGDTGKGAVGLANGLKDPAGEDTGKASPTEDRTCVGESREEPAKQAEAKPDDEVSSPSDEDPPLEGFSE